MNIKAIDKQLSNKDYLESRYAANAKPRIDLAAINTTTYFTIQESWHLLCIAANLGARTSIHGALVTFHLRSQTIWESGRLKSAIRYGKRSMVQCFVFCRHVLDFRELEVQISVFTSGHVKPFRNIFSWWSSLVSKTFFYAFPSNFQFR